MVYRKTLKYIFLITCSIAIIFPLVNIHYILPTISGLLVKITEDEAVRIAKHMASMIISENNELKTTPEIERIVVNHKEQLDLEKIKVFQDNGKIIYSSESGDIGTTNNKSYFYDVVAKGNIYTKKVEKDKKTLEGRVVSSDVVETYVPLMNGDRFIGAFEIYYDITAKNQALNQATFRASLLSFSLVFGFFIAIIIVLLRADRNTADFQITRLSAIYNSPFYLLVVIIASIFSTEAFAMLTVSSLPKMSLFEEATLDAALVVMFVSPPLYFFLVRPLIMHISIRKKAEEELQKTNDELEQRVHERTAELLEVNRNLEQEISERKKTEHKIHNAYSLMHNILDMAPYGIYMINEKGVIEYANQVMINISGIEHKKFVGINAFELPSYSEMNLTARLKEALNGRSFFMGPVKYTSNYGSKTTIRNFIGMPFEENSEKKALVFVEDITRAEQAQEEVHLAKHDWKNTFDTITDLITIHDKDCNIIRANRAGIELLGLPDLNSSDNVKCYTYFHGTDCRPDYCPSTSSQHTGKITTVEVFEPHLNKYVEFRTIPRFNDDMQFVGVIHIVRDITERKKDEKQIKTQFNRLSALRSIDRAIIGSIDIRITLDVFLAEVIKQLDVDAASVFLLNQKILTLEFVTGKGFRSDVREYSRLRVGESAAGRAAIERQIISTPDLRKGFDGIGEYAFLADEGFVSYFAVPLIAKGEVKGVLEVFNRTRIDVETDWLGFLEAIADQGAIAIDNATMFDKLQRSNIELTLAYDSTIEGWSRAMDLKDRETEGHSRRVTEMTIEIARELGIDDDELVHIRRGALLHDMGKMGIPDSILLKPGPLDDKEWIVMKRHPEYAYEMLSPIKYLKPALDIPYCHHEKWDGTGYPRGLKGEEIPLSARIFALVDVYDAMTSDRPYQSASPKEKALEYIRSMPGKHFDPKIVEVFLKLDL